MFGRESAMDGAIAEVRGGHIELAEREDSNVVAICRGFAGAYTCGILRLLE
jgi:hypothetical protein